MPRRRAALPAALGLAVPLLLTACSGGGPDPHLGVRGEVAPTGERVPAPGLRGPLVSGGRFDLAATRGKVVVLNAFGSWCTPCKEEAPALSSVARASETKGVQFVGLTVRDTPDKAAAFARDNGVTYPLVQDDDGALIARIPQLPGAPPSTLVLDRRGRFAARFLGPVLGSQLQAVVDQVAAEPA